MRFYRCIGRNTRQLLAGAGFLYAAATFPVGWTFAATSGGVTNIFKPLSTPAQAIYEVSLLVLAICAGIFLVVAGLLTYTLFRFRQRPGDDGHEPPQVYGGNQIELAWTVIPIVFVLFLATARTCRGPFRLPARSMSRWSATSGGGKFATLSLVSSPQMSSTCPSVIPAGAGRRLVSSSQSL